MTTLRKPAVAGIFYPNDPGILVESINTYLAENAKTGTVPKAIVVPHAGYMYSGPIAASAYSLLAPARKLITRVILLGPAHRVAFTGIAAHSADAFLTPLGKVSLDRELIRKLVALEYVSINDIAHATEHSLEVHLPFLQIVLDSFTLVPLLIGDCSPNAISKTLDLAWGGAETLIVISSDLSHYHSYADAQRMDRATSVAIETLDAGSIHYDNACGRLPVQGLITSARQHHLQAQLLDLRNSGDTAGPRDQVVGYGAYAFY